jgi:hypothetical protein
MTNPAQQATPATPSPEVEAMAQEWPLITALLGGTSTMRAAGKEYLPQAPAESDAAYQYRLSTSTLFNGFRRTVETLAGKPFSEPLHLNDDVPPAIVEYEKDIDLEGRNLQAFAHGAIQTALAYGLAHILVDYPPTPVGTLEDQRKSGARPYFVAIHPKNLLGWKSERINGAETLTQIRIMESAREDDGEWGVKIIPQVRVLERDNFRIYRQNEKEEWFLFGEGEVSLGMIPLVTIYGDRTGFMTARPPLLDLAYLNVEHWQSSSDQSNILHVARVPILFAAGFEDGQLTIGANTAVAATDPNAKLQYVEHTGAAIGAGRESLKALEERMSLMGAQMLVRKPGSRTATEKAIDTAESDCALSAVVLNAEDALEQALDFMAKWEGLEDGGSIEINDDFGGWMDTLDETTLLRCRELGILSAETVFNELQRRKVISEELTWLEEADRLKKEGPPVGVVGSFEAASSDA